MFHQIKPKTYSTLRMNVNILIIAQLKYFLWRINLIIFIIDAIHSTPLNLYYNTGMALWPLRSFIVLILSKVWEKKIHLVTSYILEIHLVTSYILEI